jgi:hypothetical protein
MMKDKASAMIEYASKQTQLKSVSGNHVGLCPIPSHQEKTGSFYVYDDGQAHCFGCGFHGDVFDLYQAVNGGDYVNAKKALGMWEGEHGEYKKPEPKKAVVHDLGAFFGGAELFRVGQGQNCKPPNPIRHEPKEDLNGIARLVLKDLSFDLPIGSNVVYMGRKTKTASYPILGIGREPLVFIEGCSEKVKISELTY